MVAHPCWHPRALHRKFRRQVENAARPPIGSLRLDDRVICLRQRWDLARRMLRELPDWQRSASPFDHRVLTARLGSARQDPPTLVAA